MWYIFYLCLFYVSFFTEMEELYKSYVMNILGSFYWRFFLFWSQKVLSTGNYLLSTYNISQHYYIMKNNMPYVWLFMHVNNSISNIGNASNINHQDCRFVRNVRNVRNCQEFEKFWQKISKMSGKLMNI